jgi:hypothetical protein
LKTWLCKVLPADSRQSKSLLHGFIIKINSAIKKNRHCWERTHPCVLDAKRSKTSACIQVDLRRRLIRRETRRSTLGMRALPAKTIFYKKTLIIFIRLISSIEIFCHKIFGGGVFLLSAIKKLNSGRCFYETKFSIVNSLIF